MTCPARYIGKPINYTVLDGVGLGVKHGNNQPARTDAPSRTRPPTSGWGKQRRITPHKTLEPVNPQQFLVTT